MVPYTRGEEVPARLLRRTWEDSIVATTICDSAVYRDFFAAVRQVNAGKPLAQQWRVLLGGPSIDWGVYDLSFHMGLLDDRPQLKSLRSLHRNDLRDVSGLVEFSDVEQHGAAWLEFHTGLTYYYERGAGVHAETQNETRIYGTKGGLRFQFPAWDSNEVEFFYTENGEPRKETLKVDMTDAPDDSLALTTHFLDCLDGKAQPLMTVQQAAKNMEILFKILEA